MTDKQAKDLAKLILSKDCSPLFSDEYSRQLARAYLALLANQRTPGMVEVCSVCKAENMSGVENCSGWYDGRTQDHTRCPIRAKEAPI